MLPSSANRLLGVVLAPLAVIGLILSSCAPTAPPQAPPPPESPKLILYIVVDQVRADYLERFRPLFTGGFERLLGESIVFRDAQHFHSETVTATGHATLATGCLPRHHGIVGNGWFDRELGRTVTSVADRDYGRSPRALLVPTLGDLLNRTYPPAKVYAIGGKDRSAILTAGREADAAFWYDADDGTFQSSSYYLDDLPEWLQDFNDSRYLDRYFGKTWTPLFSLDELAPYDVEPVDWGYRDRQFPHPLGGLSAYPDDDFYGTIAGTPFLDEYVVELAKALIDGERLGQDEIPDFLGVTLPATDAAGHRFGPNSPELADTVVRLDRTLGTLLDFVDERIGLDNVLVSLSADHGVGAVPELLERRGDATAGRLDDEAIVCFESLGADLSAKFGDEQWLRSGLYFDRSLLEERGIDRRAMETEIRSRLEACPGVARVYSGAELDATPPDELDAIARLFFNGYYRERSPDLLVQLDPNVLAAWSVLASHGSPYPYDTHVPWLLRRPDGRSSEVVERVHTIDVLPTLLAITGLDLGPMEIDGEDRSALFAP